MGHSRRGALCILPRVAVSGGSKVMIPITAEAVLSMAQVGLLVAIFARLGALSAHVENVKERVNQLERKADAESSDLQ